MNSKNLNQILLLLTYCATQHDTINAMKRPHAQISNIQQNKQLPPALKKTKLNNKTAAFVCVLCNKNFNSSSNLSRHKKIHTGEKPYSCNFCDKGFSQSNDLKKHKRIHTGEKPYNCNTCGKSFADQSNFRKHEKKHTISTPTINLEKNNAEQIPTQIIKNISLKSLNTAADFQNILENTNSLTDTEFHDWINKKK